MAHHKLMNLILVNGVKVLKLEKNLKPFNVQPVRKNKFRFPF